MSDTSLLEMLKIDLGISTTVYDERLGLFLTSAQAEISGKGYTFSETLTIKEKQIIVRYAGWKYRVSRGADSPAMPDDIRYCIHDMVCSQKMGGGSGV